MLKGSAYFELLLHFRATTKVPTKPKKNAPAEIPARRDVEYFSSCTLCVFCNSTPPAPGTHELCNHWQNGGGQFCGSFRCRQGRGEEEEEEEEGRQVNGYFSISMKPQRPGAFLYKLDVRTAFCWRVGRVLMPTSARLSLHS